MDVTIRLYWKTDADLLALSQYPNFNIQELMRLSVIAWANNDRDFCISCPVGRISTVIKSKVVHIQFRGEDEQYIIDKLNQIKYGWKSTLIKTLLRGYLDQPYTECFMEYNDYVINKDKITQYSETPSYAGQNPAYKERQTGKPIYEVKKSRGNYKKKKKPSLSSIVSYTPAQTIPSQDTLKEIASDNTAKIVQQKQNSENFDVAVKPDVEQKADIPTETTVQQAEMVNENLNVTIEKEDIVKQPEILSSPQTDVQTSIQTEVQTEVQPDIQQAENQNSSEAYSSEQEEDDGFDLFGSIEKMM